MIKRSEIKFFIDYDLLRLITCTYVQHLKLLLSDIAKIKKLNSK